MITAVFFQKNNELRGFEVSGHAEHGDPGTDIVCAGVSTAVQLTSNGITEIVGTYAKVRCQENNIKLSLADGLVSEGAVLFLQALLLQLQLMAEDYGKCIQIQIMEV